MPSPDHTSVLLLDDDPTWLRSLARVLGARGARCTTLIDPGATLDAIAQSEPRVVVLDFHLDTASTGADVARSLRDHLRASCPPLLLVSGTLDEVSEVDRAPFDAAYGKQMPVRDLAEAILSWAAKAQSASSYSSLCAKGPGEDDERKRNTSG